MMILNRLHPLRKRSIISPLHLSPCPCICNLIQQQTQTQKQQFTTTYYDSQSGMHVALHNENEVSLFTQISSSQVLEHSSGLEVGNPHMSIGNRIESIKEAGFHGVALDTTSTKITSDLISSINENAGSSSEKEFKLFLHPSSLSLLFQNKNPIRGGNSLHAIFDYYGSNSESDDLHQTLQQFNEKNNNGIKTVIRISNFITDDDPIMIANGVANLIDETGCGDIVWLTTKSQSQNHGGDICVHDLVDCESIIALLEELSYLDIPGQTMKSRLVVDMVAADTNETETGEIVEECLTVGINKFAINEKKFEWFKTRIIDNGKTLV